jgi:ABC-type microcin C transport system permease subunit YejB
MDKSISVTLPGPSSRTARLPLLVEISLTVTQILVFVVAVTTAVLSIIARAEILTIFLRTAVAILAVGIPAFLLNWMLGRFFVDTTVEEWKNAIPKKESKVTPETQTENLEVDA